MHLGQLRTSAALALLVGLAASAHGTTITVNSTADSLAVDGNCTLREAIIAANTDTAVDACPAGNGADVVVVPAGTYTLTLVGAGEDAAATGDLDVTADLEIDGAGAGTTIIDGNGTDRVLDIDPGAVVGLTVLVSGVTLQNGAGVLDGGAVRNQSATLTIADSIVRASQATGIGGGIASEADGSLHVERCTIRDNSVSDTGPVNGGGIAAGPLDVIDSTITNNTAFASGPNPQAAGGGISAGDLTMAGTTVSGNLASVAFDRFAPGPAFGGGLAINSATIRNSTISGNFASTAGNGIVPGPGLTLLNVTVADVITVVGGHTTLVLQNTIASSCSTFAGGSFTTVGDDYNIIDSDGTCSLSGTDMPGVDPLLAPLADNGGPTFTQGLIVGSPAIDAGNPAAPGSGGLACEATDQRGVVRPVGSRCDIGAFEGSVTTTTSTSTTITTTTGTTTTTLCPAAPSEGCQPALGGKALLTFKAPLDSTVKQRLSWRWISSAAVPEGDFEDPVMGANGYTLCLYDQSNRRRAEVTAPAGGVCGESPCWKRTSSGFVYTDRPFNPDGLEKVVLKAGVAAGKAKITITGRGTNLPRSILPLTLPVRVQILRDFTPTCWEATFSTSGEDTIEVFAARSDP